MQVVKPATHLPSTGKMAEVRKLISDYLCGNCSVRIEHTPRIVDRHVHWDQWGEAFFALKDATPVIDGIVACRAEHPDHTIRLCAERLHPQSRLVFWV